MEHSDNECDGEEYVVADVKLSQDKDGNGDDDMDNQDGWAPSTFYYYDLILVSFNLSFALKHFNSKEYFTFSQSIFFFSKHFGCKFNAQKHIKELRPPNFKIKTLSWAELFQLNITVLQLHMSRRDIIILFYGVYY